MGVAEDAPERATILANLGNILVLQGKAKEAQAVYAQLDGRSTVGRRRERKSYKLSGVARSRLCMRPDKSTAGIAAAEQLIKRETARKGAEQFRRGDRPRPARNRL